VRHVVKNGQTLGILARRYGTTVEAIQRANGLKGTFIKAKRVLNIPRPGQASAPPRLAPPVIPPRRLPPPRSAAVPQGSGPA
jgi:penicillin-insensitive murein endopeptidase